jgi:purine nucleoside permease
VTALRIHIKVAARIHSASLFMIAALALLALPSRADCHIRVRVVVVTTFQTGDDNNPVAGEFGHWVLYLPLPKTIPFPQGYHHLRYNPELQVLGIVTGEGKSHAAASIMGLGMDPRFDLSKAYWIVAAIAGVDPNQGSVASTAWARFVVDGDLGYQIDAREIPPGWPTGYVPLGRSSPYEAPSQPFNSNGVQQVCQLNGSLADWAFRLTQNIHLPDDSTLQQIRAGYPNYPNALKPPFVLEGDDLAADTFWLGNLFNTWAERWMYYWTVNKGSFACRILRTPASARRSDFCPKPAAPIEIASWCFEAPATTPCSLAARLPPNFWPMTIRACPASTKPSMTFTRSAMSS